MNIYIDESGDLGSIKKSGKYFIVGLISVKNPREIDIWMRRIRSRKLTKKQKKLTEIKAGSISSQFKEYFYQHIKKLDFQINFIVIDKSKIPVKFKKQQGLIYLYMVKEGIANLAKKEYKQILITIDRRHFQAITKDGFNTSLKEFVLMNCKSVMPKIHHIDSTANRLLQFTDFLVYAAGRKYNAKDSKWYRYIKKFIKKEKIIKLTNKK